MARGCFPGVIVCWSLIHVTKFRFDETSYAQLSFSMECEAKEVSSNTTPKSHEVDAVTISFMISYTPIPVNISHNLFQPCCVTVTELPAVPKMNVFNG